MWISQPAWRVLERIVRDLSYIKKIKVSYAADANPVSPCLYVSKRYFAWKIKLRNIYNHFIRNSSPSWMVSFCPQSCWTFLAVDGDNINDINENINEKQCYKLKSLCFINMDMVGCTGLVLNTLGQIFCYTMLV